MKQLLKSICLCVAVGMVMSCSIFKLYKKNWWCYKKYDTDLDISIIDVKES